MKSTKDIVKGAAEKLHVLVIGRQGSGKTYALRTWPNPYVADFDGKIDSLAGCDVLYETFIPGHPDTDALLERYGIKEKKSCRSVLRAFGKWLGEAVQEIMEKHNGIGTIAVDSFTNFSEVLMGAIREANGQNILNDDPYGGRLRLSEGAAPQVQEYGIFNQKMRRILLEWRRVPCCFVLNAHDRFEKDELTGEIRMLVETQGTRICNRIADAFGEIWLTKVVYHGRGARFLYTIVNPRGPAATRLGLPSEFPQDWREIKRLIEEARHEESPKTEERVVVSRKSKNAAPKSLR